MQNVIWKISYNCKFLKITKDFQESRDCYHASVGDNFGKKRVPLGYFHLLKIILNFKTAQLKIKINVKHVFSVINVLKKKDRLKCPDHRRNLRRLFFCELAVGCFSQVRFVLFRLPKITEQLFFVTHLEINTLKITIASINEP